PMRVSRVFAPPGGEDTAAEICDLPHSVIRTRVDADHVPHLRVKRQQFRAGPALLRLPRIIRRVLFQKVIETDEKLDDVRDGGFGQARLSSNVWAGDWT